MESDAHIWKYCIIYDGPAVQVKAAEGSTQYVLDMETFNKIVDGEMPFSELEDGELIVRAIMKDWVTRLGVR